MTMLDKARQARLIPPAVQRLMKAVQDAGSETRVVGGAVRDVLLYRTRGDIDLATPLPPERMIDILARQGIKTVPTGLAHGTITAVVDHVGYEITTLRRDVETDGRHAQVAFTDDWRTDAARRDFTFNALYVDASGQVYDYFGGAADAAAGLVRFIGDARARIGEDYLRILRFFRFYAWFGQGDPDRDALSACREQAVNIPRLSVERIAREILKLLAAENPVAAWRFMNDCGVTPHFAPQATDLTRLQTLVDNEKRYAQPPQALTRLAALLPQDDESAASIAARLKFSTRDRETLIALAKLPALLNRDVQPAALRRALYAHGADSCRAALMLVGSNIAAALPVIDAWENPVFPIRGQDIVACGVPAGPRIGDILRQIEDDWIAGDFRADRDACLAAVTRYGKNT